MQVTPEYTFLVVFFLMLVGFILRVDHLENKLIDLQAIRLRYRRYIKAVWMQSRRHDTQPSCDNELDEMEKEAKYGTF